MKRYSLPFILLLSACAPAQRPAVVDPAFTQYVQKWNSLYPDHLANEVSIKFDDLSKYSDSKGTVVGLCSYDDNGDVVSVDPTFWNKVLDYTREELMFHELGHCVLGLKHNCSLKPDGTPVSVMYPYVFELSDTTESYYFNELKTDQSNCD